MKLSKLKNSFEELFLLEDKKNEENKTQIEQLIKKLYEKRKNLEKKAKNCDECEEEAELKRKLKAVNKLIKKAKKNF